MDFNFYKKKNIETINKGNDNSKKGSIDKEIVLLVNLINSRPEFYTTSSCAGRVMLISRSKKEKKNESNWLYVSHEKGDCNEILKILKNLTTKDKVWLKQEPMILHLVAKDIDDANKILSLANSVGFKHSGILSTSNRIIIEIDGIEKLETLVAVNQKMLPTESYLKLLVQECNRKLKKNRLRIQKFEQKIKAL